MTTQLQKPTDTEIIAIAAINHNFVIADDGDIPWDIKADKKHYKETVSDSPVLIGRKTYEDAPSLPGINIVLTRTGLDEPTKENVYEAQSVEEAFQIINDLQLETVYNVGGSEIYNLFLKYTDKLIISHIDDNTSGDTHFPKFDKENWKIIATDEQERFTIKTYTRV